MSGGDWLLQDGSSGVGECASGPGRQRLQVNNTGLAYKDWLPLMGGSHVAPSSTGLCTPRETHSY